SSTDGCTSTCKYARCGDGIVQAGMGEECDDANTSDTDSCLNTCKRATCGDGFVFAGTEECDDGNLTTETCPYGAGVCQVCNAACHEVNAIGSTCGDGVVNAPEEVCDDGNSNSCGSCDASCRTVKSAFAKGYIVAVAGASLGDGQMFTLNDGMNPP